MSSKLRAGSWIVAAACGVGGFAAVPHAVVERFPEPARTVGRELAVTVSRLETRVDTTWRIAPFRADRTPPLGPYDAGQPSEIEMPPPEQPAWRLAGVLTGAATVAVFEELPGNGNATYLLSVGDQVGPYTVERIRADSAVVRAGSARWSFLLEAPWR